MADSSEPEVRGDVASRAIKKHISKLSKVLMSEDIVTELFEEDFITDSTFDELVAQARSEAQSGRRDVQTFRGTELVREVQDVVNARPQLYNLFCQILEKNSCEKLSKSIQVTYTDLIKTTSGTQSCQQSPAVIPLGKEFQQLQEDLAFYNRQLSKEIGSRDNIFDLIKSLIRNAIESALKTCESLDSVKKQMHSLCYDTVSVPTRLSDWAVQEVTNIYDKLSPQSDVEAPLSPECKDLFSMDALYHSSLCCHAVNKCSNTKFREVLNVSGHSLQEATMSVMTESSNDRCLIALQDSIMYVAFQSEPTLTSWLQNSYTSFEEGFRQQMSRFPLRFFVEQLGEHKQIIFTGYSFGGMLACYVAANLWKENCVTLDVLRRNVICITFAQPLIALPFVDEVTGRFSDAFKESVHAFFSHEDPLPFVFSYFNGIQGDNHDRLMRQPLSTVDFKDSFPRQFFHTLITVFEEKSYSTAASSPSKSVDQALSDLKKHLSTTKGRENLRKSLPFTKMNSLENIDLNELWIESENAADNLNSIVLKKRGMEEYHKKTRTYLGSRKRALPKPSPKKELKNITLLKPQVKGVELHKFPSEHAVVVEGDHLWFCHEILLGDGKNIINITNSMESVSRHVIQFNYSPTTKTNKVISSDGIVKVTLSSHFAKSIRKRVKVEQKPHEFSQRQMQLASYTPTEVICLAYWSAVLEQHPNTDYTKSQFQQSQRLKKIREFLEEAVKVVPFESVLNAIAFAEDKTAIKCAEALIESKVPIPSSVEVLSSMQLGSVRLRTGMHGFGIISLRDGVLKEVSLKARVNHLRPVSISAPTSKEIQFTMTGSVPGYALGSMTGKGRYADVTSPQTVTHSVNITAATNLEHIPEGIFRSDTLADKLSAYSDQLTRTKVIVEDYLCNMNIECIYPTRSSHVRHSLYSSSLQSPLDVLHNARVQIALHLEELHDDLDVSGEDDKPINERMLDVLKEIDENCLKVCAALLGSFMEQKVVIPLIKSEMDTANILTEKSSPVAMGAWVLFSLGYPELHAKLSSLRGHPLMVEIADYIYGVLGNKLDTSSKTTSPYDGKLQFLLQGVSRIVSCSSQYISYSLERQLSANLKFDKSIPVKELVAKWDRIFKGDALSLVAKPYRSLIARWLKWAVLIHDLREALAEYTCVGVFGLMNSGKSQLVSKLFGIQTVIGTTKRRRTTVPLLYNLDGKVDGLDVIDFPGIDDKEFSIPRLAPLLLGLLQVVIFVVHHDRATSEASLSWLKYLKKKKIPVIICMTHGDVLYFEEEDRRQNDKFVKEKDEITEEVRREIGSEVYCKQKELRQLTECDFDSVNLYYFHLPTVYSNRVEDLRHAGILGIKDVGNELAESLKHYSGDLSQRLTGFVQKGDQSALLPLHDKDIHSRPVSKYASILEQIPFIEQPTVFRCDSAGGIYTDDSNGISVTIPKNAIPQGQVIRFEMAVTLHGPFSFAAGRRPISPILWICTQEKVSFKKLIEVKLPHFLPGLTDQEASKYGVGFSKATHFTSPKATSFDFTPFHTKQQFIVDEDGSYGTLLTDHCCFMCIEANHSQELVVRAGYCLSRVEYRLSPSRYAIHFCATFMLRSCLRSVGMQYSDKKPNITYSEFKFKDNPDTDEERHIMKLIRPTDLDSCQIALDPKKGQIRASSIDFWMESYDVDKLKLKHEHLLYPPRIKMTVVLNVSDLILPIFFEGCTKESDIDVDLSISGVPSQMYTSSSVESESTKKADVSEDTKLSIDDHFTVTKYLDDLANKQIIRLGTALGLLYPKLKNMDNLPDDMVYAWLLKEDKVLQIGAPTWANLVKALKEISQNGVAETIEREKLGKSE